MDFIIEGRCWKLGDYVPTDLITPKEVLSDSPQEMAKHMFEQIDPELPKNIKKNDIIVAGKNFGCSSSRIAAVKALQGAGVGAVIAESISRIFYRNLIGIGLPALECEGISNFVEKGDTIQVNLVTGEIKNIKTGRIIMAKKPPEFFMDVLNSGGIIPYLHKKGILD